MVQDAERSIDLFVDVERQIRDRAVALASVEELWEGRRDNAALAPMQNEPACQQRKIVPAVLVNAPARVDVQSAPARTIAAHDHAGGLGGFKTIHQIRKWQNPSWMYQ